MSDSREYPPRPICGVGVVVRKGDSVLLIQRGRAPRLGEWALPGGAVELGESLNDAARREIREECGIEIQLGEVVEAFDLILRDDSGQVQFHYIIIDFAATYGGGDLRVGSDVLDARWVALTELEPYGLHEKTREVIRKAVNHADQKRKEHVIASPAGAKQHLHPTHTRPEAVPKGVQVSRLQSSPTSPRRKKRSS